MVDASYIGYQTQNSVEMVVETKIWITNLEEKSRVASMNHAPQVAHRLRRPAYPQPFSDYPGHVAGYGESRAGQGKVRAIYLELLSRPLCGYGGIRRNQTLP